MPAKFIPATPASHNPKVGDFAVISGDLYVIFKTPNGHFNAVSLHNGICWTNNHSTLDGLVSYLTGSTRFGRFIPTDKITITESL